MRRRSRFCVLAGLMGGMSLLAVAAPPAQAANKAVGGDSIAVASANGGDGGSVVLHIDPLATSGNSGAAVAQSSATNTGNAVNAVKVTAVGGDGGNAGNNVTAKSGKGGNAIIH